MIGIIAVVIACFLILLFFIIVIGNYFFKRLSDLFIISVDRVLGCASDEDIKGTFDPSGHLNYAIARHNKALLECCILKLDQIIKKLNKNISKERSAKKPKSGNEGV